MIYSTDSDDSFPLVMAETHNPATADGFASTSYAWQNLIQPYAKSWALMVSPLSKFQRSDPLKTNDVFFNFGMTPNSGMAQIPSFGDTYYSEGEQVQWNGVGGAYNDLNFWGMDATTGSDLKGGNSLSQTSIARPAEELLITDAYGPDMWGTYSMTDPSAYAQDMFHYCWTWDSELGAGVSVRAGAIARVGQTPPTTCSTMRRNGGYVTSGFADGHAANLAIKNLYSVKTTSGNQRVYKFLWPSE